LQAVVEGDRVTRLTCTPPLTAKICPGVNGPEMVIVSSAACLLDGDCLRVEIDVGANSRLTVRSVAAQVAYPAPCHGTVYEVCLRVGDGSQLTWTPEPLLVCAAGQHRSSLTVDLSSSGRVMLLDELVFGRSGEDPSDAQLAATVTISRDGRPMLVDGLDTSLPGAWGPAVLGDSRYVGTMVDSSATPAPGDGWIGLAGRGALCRVLDSSPASGRQTLASIRHGVIS
jgi:urease accessory protein UreH